MDETLSSHVEIIDIDFRNPDRLNHSQLSAIRIVQENLARNLTVSLSNLLRRPMLIGFKEMEQRGFQKRSTLVDGKAVFAALSISPGRGKALIEIPYRLAIPLLEMLLGAAPATSAQKNSLTEVEIRLLETVLRSVLQDWKEAWSQVLSIDFHLISIETRQEFLDVFYQGETVVCSVLNFQSGDLQEQMNLHLPALLLKERLHEQLTKKKPQEQEVPQRPERVLNIIGAAKIQIEVRNEAPRLRLRDLLALQKDDIIVLSGDPTEARVCVNGIPQWIGRLRSERNRRFVKLEPAHELPESSDIPEMQEQR